MAYQYALKLRIQLIGTCSLLSSLLCGLLPAAVVAQPTPSQSPVQVTVNSSKDGPVIADTMLTLREAIEIVNGTRLLNELSAEEQQLITTDATNSIIRFALPAGQTTIELIEILPAIAQPNVVVDGRKKKNVRTSTTKFDVFDTKYLKYPNWRLLVNAFI